MDEELKLKLNYVAFLPKKAYNISMGTEQLHNEPLRNYAEKPDIRSTALHTLHDALSWMQFIDPNTKEQYRDLTPQEEWVVKAAQEAMKNINVKRGKSTFIREWFDDELGKTIHTDEGIPIDGILDWLHGNNNEREIAGNEELQERFDRNRIINTLERFSCPYLALCKDDETFTSRVRLEKSFIENDIRNTGNDEDNKKLAQLTMDSRKEFILPRPQFSEDEISRQELRNMITGSKNSDYTEPDNSTEGASFIKKEALATAALTAFPTTVLVDLYRYDSLMKGIGTTAAIGISAAATRYINKNRREADLYTDNSKMETIENFLKIGTLPILANVYGPDAAISLVNSVGDEAVEIVKAGAFFIFYQNLSRTTRIVKGPVISLGKSFLNKLGRDIYREYTPFNLDPTKSPLSQARTISGDAFNLLTDVTPAANYFSGKIPDSLLPDKKIRKKIDPILLKIIQNRFAEDPENPAFAFLQYEALYSFIQFIHKEKNNNHMRKSSRDIKGVENTVLDTLQNLDELALSAFPDPQTAFHLNDFQLNEFQEAKVNKHGMAYLLSLQELRDDDDPQKQIVKEQLEILTKLILGDLVISEKKMQQRIRDLKMISVKDNVEENAKKRFGSYGKGLVRLVFTRSNHRTS